MEKKLTPLDDYVAKGIGGWDPFLPADRVSRKTVAAEIRAMSVANFWTPPFPFDKSVKEAAANREAVARAIETGRERNGEAVTEARICRTRSRDDADVSRGTSSVATRPCISGVAQ